MRKINSSALAAAVTRAAARAGFISPAGRMAPAQAAKATALQPALNAPTAWPNAGARPGGALVVGIAAVVLALGFVLGTFN